MPWERADYQWFQDNPSRRYHVRKPFPEELLEWKTRNGCSSYWVYVALINERQIAYFIQSGNPSSDTDERLCRAFAVIKGFDICKQLQIPIEVYFRPLLKGQDYGLNGSCILPEV